jgi:hypothetical protein
VSAKILDGNCLIERAPERAPVDSPVPDGIAPGNRDTHGQ